MPRPTTSRTRIPLAGRLLTLAGILLVALTLRMAVTSVSPLIDMIRVDIELSPFMVGLLGMMPTLAFGVFGFLTPYVVRAASLERLVVAAMLAAIVGQVARIFTTNSVVFLLLSLLALGGLGAGNVLLPPLVRKYFPDRIGVMTSLYVLGVSIGTALPPYFAVPVGQAAGWHTSTALWAGFSIIAILPWISRLAHRNPPGTLLPRPAAAGSAAAGPGAAAGVRRINLWRSPGAIGLTLMMGLTSLNTYAMFAWLPQIVADAGIGARDAGNLLGLFAFVGVPLSLLVPIVAARLRNPFPMVVLFMVSYVVGYAGILTVPQQATWLWVAFIGLGPGTFPLALVMINLRTRTQDVTNALSGFTQGLGYLLACLGPLLVGAFRTATGGWALSLGFLTATIIFLTYGAWLICRPRMVDDEPGVVRVGRA